MTGYEINQTHNELDKIESKNIKIEDLITGTIVDVFNSKNFTGYQREINDSHVSKIVKYTTDTLEQGNFLFPTPIICALRKGESKLYIVDGQHRINAFQSIKNDNPEVFDKIKNYEINIIILINPTIKLEVETFITINKTSKKVDTSLALIAKTLHSELDTSRISAKKQYILVETAQKLSKNSDSYFYDNIAWEGTPRSTGKLISLSAFVRAYMPIINYLTKYNVIDLEETSKFKEHIDLCSRIINEIWKSFRIKWPQLFEGNKNSIIQGTIGSTAIVKFIYNYLNGQNIETVDSDTLYKEIKTAITKINDNYENWLPNGKYSNYSSGAGHTIISKSLIDSLD